jgi:predicted alpha/beta-fold hydrolase
MTVTQKLVAATISVAATLVAAATLLAAPLPSRLEMPTNVVRTQARNLNTDAQIVLMRGLANVFSRGMDEMAETLTGHGFTPRLINHRGWQNAADTIAQNYRNGNRAPIIVIGHSLGANAGFRLAARLQSQNVPVAYLAVFDPTQSLAVPTNVDTFVNFYLSRSGRPARFAATRNESKVNLNLSTSPGITHTNIDQTRRLQDIVINRILQITERQPERRQQNRRR